MSTRCNVIIKDQYDEVILYRHSDGYPEGVEDSINLFLRWLRDGKIRRCAIQSSGWLILIGAMEYSSLPAAAFALDEERRGKYGYHPDEHILTDEQKALNPADWKAGAYEPTTGIHGDIEYLHVIDLDAQAWKIDGEDGYRYKGKFRTPQAA